jgi:calcium-dependent protein kinase
MDVHDQRIFAAEQIEVPDDFPGLLKNFIKEVVRSQPDNVATFSRQYFETLLKARGKYTEISREKVILSPKEFYLEHKDNIKDHYELHENIGDATTSRVRRGVHKVQKISRAIKVVKKEDLEFGERRKLLEEVNLLKKLDHPNIASV